ncbi:MAG: hypothetical protein ACK5LS_10065 [Propioniciclava sp.]
MTLKDSIHTVWIRHVRPRVRSPLVRWMNTGTLRWHRAVIASRPFTAYCVYRARNATYVRSLIDTAPVGSAFHLHALDAPAPPLASWTRTTGPGARMHLFNALLREHPPQAGEPVMFADDDVSFLSGGVGRFVGLADAASLDVAQPAHARGGHSTYAVTRAEALSTVRLVAFVESGPVVVLSAEAAARLLPFPAELQMGWGVDVWWSALQDPPLRIGVVDATPVLHHGPVGVAYPNDPEQQILDRFLARAKVTSTVQLDRNLGLTWRPWQRRPRWINDQPG